MMRGSGRVFAVVLGLLLGMQAQAASGFHGEFDLGASYMNNGANSLAAALGERRYADQDSWLRLMWSGPLASGWGLDIAYLATARHGGGVVLTRREYTSDPALYIDPQRTTLLRLNDTVTDEGQLAIAQRLDRLALTYSGSHLVLRLGRQALTWGGGLVFHPMDLFNPFPPNATYTTYKPGADMLYGQWLFNSGADLQMVAVPRRDPTTGHIEPNQGSAGIKWHGSLGLDQGLGIDLLAAQDYGSQVLGIRISGAWAGASWTAELVPTQLAIGGVRTSVLANAQYAWVLGAKDINGYLEYFHNGFGVTGTDHTLADLPTALVERLARGEVFTVSRDYLAVGAGIQWTPLLILKPSVIANLDDGSVLVIGQAVYSLTQNTDMTAGIQRGFGGHHTEYGGGLETAPNSGVFVAPATSIYARLMWYFQ
ncbi:MAG TPA: hypothetical protein VMV40_09850 [Acidiferrobacter sp.]|nr:hypothetical protein [Acidiferrobacter sp.]